MPYKSGCSKSGEEAMAFTHLNTKLLYVNIHCIQLYIILPKLLTLLDAATHLSLSWLRIFSPILRQRIFKLL